MRYKNFVLIQVAPLLVFLAACIGEEGERMWGKYKPPRLAPHPGRRRKPPAPPSLLRVPGLRSTRTKSSKFPLHVCQRVGDHPPHRSREAALAAPPVGLLQRPL